MIHINFITIENANSAIPRRDEEKSITEFYKFYEEHLMHLKSITNRENSIQLVYQLSILIHNYLNFPVIELVYGDRQVGIPTVLWCFKLTLQCISALLSAYSTLSLPISVAEMRSVKESGTYCSVLHTFCLLSKRVFQLIFHLCTTYLVIFLVMESDRFQYLRQFILGKTGETNFEKYGFVIYGSIIFCTFPFLLILSNVLVVLILLTGESGKKLREIFSRFGKTIRIRFRSRHDIRDDHDIFDLDFEDEQNILKF